MLVFIYIGVALGFHEVTGRFWDSTFWPLTLGSMAGRHFKKQES